MPKRASSIFPSVIANAVIEANQGETPVLEVEEGEPVSIEEVVAASEEPVEEDK